MEPRTDKENDSKIQAAERIFRESGGTLRTMEAIRQGIHPRTLYAMRDAGLLERLGRGLYRLASLPPLEQPDLVAVARRVPSGVICLFSALSFHEMTTEIPHVIWLALRRGSRPPRLEHPPVEVVWITGQSFSEGVEAHEVDGVRLRVTSPAKTVVDCFKFRNRVGLETAISALKAYLSEKRGTVDDLLALARVCRVEKVMRPYIEALL